MKLGVDILGMEVRAPYKWDVLLAPSADQARQFALHSYFPPLYIASAQEKPLQKRNDHPSAYSRAL